MWLIKVHATLLLFYPTSNFFLKTFEPLLEMFYKFYINTDRMVYLINRPHADLVRECSLAAIMMSN